MDVQAITRDQSGNYYAGTMYEGVYKSTDNGVTWEQVNNGLPVAAQNQITAIFNDPLDGILVAFYPNGVYRPTDQGANWIEF